MFRHFTWKHTLSVIVGAAGAITAAAAQLPILKPIGAVAAIIGTVAALFLPSPTTPPQP